MPEPTTWYEIVGYYYYKPQIIARLVSSETACYVFHPNGRKSSKGGTHGVDWHKSWMLAKTELIRRANLQIESAKMQLQRVNDELVKVLELEEPHVKAESNLTTAVEVGPANGAV
jgi:hypothetical protein